MVADLPSERSVRSLGRLHLLAQRAQRTLEARLAVARVREGSPHLGDAPRRLGVLGLELGTLSGKRGQIALESVRLALRGLEVLVTGQPLRLPALHGGDQRRLPLPEDSEHGLERFQLRPLLIDGDRARRYLVAKLTYGPLTAKERVLLRLAISIAPPAGKPAGRREHLADRRHVGRDHAVPPPQALGLVKMVHHADPAEEIAEQRRPRPADQP